MTFNADLKAPAVTQHFPASSLRVQKKTTLVIRWSKGAKLKYVFKLYLSEGACSHDSDVAFSCSRLSDLKLVQKPWQVAVIGSRHRVIDPCSGSGTTYSEAGGLEDTTAAMGGHEILFLLSQEALKSNKVANKAVREELF